MDRNIVWPKKAESKRLEIVSTAATKSGNIRFQDDGNSNFGEPEQTNQKSKNVNNSPDSYSGKLLKLIPADAVAMYVTVNSVIKSANSHIPLVVEWIVFSAAVILTYLYLRILFAIKSQIQLIFSVLSFMVWGYSIGGPFESYSWYNKIYSAILIPIFTFALPLVKVPSNINNQ